VSALRAVLAAAIAWLGAPAAQAAPPPAQDYVLECRGCHGARGEGAGSVPSLAQSARFLATPRGRSYLVRVPGVAGSQLSDARVAALLTWVLRELASDPPAPAEFAPFTAAEVARERARKLLDPRAERAAALAETR
jgi:mono/diheme cytochrome c family protein